MTMPTPAEPTFALTPLPRHKLTESVAQRLLEEIQRANLPAGTRMPSERELMEQLGVGRSTVREALKGLALLGVLEIRHGQGAFLVRLPTAPTLDDALVAALARGVTDDLLEARRAIEGETARLAAARRTSADLGELERVLEQHELALQRGRPAVKPSAQFHLELAEAAHNEVLAGCVASFMRLLVERGPMLESIDGYRRFELDQHRGLYDAVRAQDEALAVERMQAHLQAVASYHDVLQVRGR